MLDMGGEPDGDQVRLGAAADKSSPRRWRPNGPAPLASAICIGRLTRIERESRLQLPGLVTDSGD